MNEYLEIPKESAYALLSPGPLVLISTVSSSGVPDIAPVAWTSPLDYGETSRVLFVLDPGHLTAENIRSARKFAICLPHPSQKEMVMRTGAVSGRELDKFASVGIESFPAKTSSCRIPEGVTGWIECGLDRIYEDGDVIIVTGSALASFVRKGGWNGRLLPGNEEGKTLHYLGEGAFGILTPLSRS